MGRAERTGKSRQWLGKPRGVTHYKVVTHNYYRYVY